MEVRSSSEFLCCPKNENVDIIKSGMLLLPAVLSMMAGAVDVIGFLALGVFTAHITGNLIVEARSGGFSIIETEKTSEKALGAR
jgi:Protein of unknown function (DUF1275)